MVKRERNIKTEKFARHRKINIVHYVTRQYMQINKKRTFTTFIGIMFMVMLMTCVFVGKDTAVKYLQSMAAAKQGSWHAIIYDVNKEKRNQVERLEGVDRAAASVDFGMAEFDRSNNEERPYLNFKAYEKDCFNWYNIMVTSGRLPQNKNEIIVSKACIDDGSNLKIGDTVEAEFFERTITGVQKDSNVTVFPYYGFEIKKGETLAPPQDFMYVENNEDLQENKEYTGKKETYTVVGFMKTPFFESENGAAYTAITYLDNETAKTVENINISLTFVFDMKNDAMSNLEELMDIVGDARLEYNDYVLMFSGDSSDSTFYLLVNIMTVFFVALIMLASIILIYNVFNLSFRERCRYLGMLSSVGATARQKRSNIYYEAFYLLVPALFAGILLGFVIIKAGMSMLKPFIAQFLSLLNLDEPAAVTLCINVKAILLIVIVSVVTVLISSFLPARKIGKIGAVESIRGNENQKNKIYRIQKRNIKWFGAEGLLAGAGLKRQGRKKKSISLSIIIFMVILLVTAFGSGAIHKVADNKTKNYNLSHKLKENQGCLSFLPDQSDLTKEEYLNKRRGYDTLKEELRNNPNVLNMQEISESMFVGSVDSGVLSGEYWDAYYDVIKQYYDNNYTKKEFEKEYKAAYNHAINVIAMDNKTLSDIADKTGADYENTAAMILCRLRI